MLIPGEQGRKPQSLILMGWALLVGAQAQAPLSRRQAIISLSLRILSPAGEAVSTFFLALSGIPPLDSSSCLSSQNGCRLGGLSWAVLVVTQTPFCPGVLLLVLFFLNLFIFYLFDCMCLSCGVRACSVTSVVSDTLQPHGLYTTRLLCPWDSPGKNTGVGCHFLLQEIFPIQGLNPCLFSLLHWQADSLPLAPPGKPPLAAACRI